MDSVQSGGGVSYIFKRHWVKIKPHLEFTLEPPGSNTMPPPAIMTEFWTNTVSSKLYNLETLSKSKPTLNTVPLPALVAKFGTDSISSKLSTSETCD